MEKRSVCICDVCGHVWLPKSGMPKRCSSSKCKSIRWHVANIPAEAETVQTYRLDRKGGKIVPNPPVSVSALIEQSELPAGFRMNRGEVVCDHRAGSVCDDCQKILDKWRAK